MTERDPDAVLRFVEAFASSLVDAGFPRMPALVFAGLHTADSGRLTAAELAGLLRVSPAAISGAVRYLTQVHLIRREREAGSRRDRYVVDNEIWYQAILDRDKVLLRWQHSAKAGVEALGPDTPAGRRLSESVAFFAFLHQEIPVLMTRWQRLRDEQRLSQQP